jgi:hypothetical protein
VDTYAERNCGTWPYMPDDWVQFPGIEGKNFNLSQYELVKNYWQSKYRCNTKDVTFRKCVWSESSSTLLTVSNISVDLSAVTLSVLPYIQTPFGFWHNESHYIIDWKENNSLKKKIQNNLCYLHSLLKTKLFHFI